MLKKTKIRIGVILTIVVLGATLMGLIMMNRKGENTIKIEEVSKKSGGETTIIIQKVLAVTGFDCQTTKCIEVSQGEKVNMFGGLVTCQLLAGTHGWYKVKTCLIQDLFSGKCRFTPCSPPQSGGKSQCRTNSDCPDGACVLAKFIDSELVDVEGFCSPVPKMYGGPDVQFRCTCLAY